jgi:pimeloyl-ACP methyl ester carboxylesterase
MRQERAIDGFRLAYDRTGRGPEGPAVVLLHGWPGDRTDYREVVPLLSAAADVIVPDLRGFGESDKHEAEPASQYGAAAQARSIVGLISELALRRPVIAVTTSAAGSPRPSPEIPPIWSAPWSSRLRCPG